MSNEQNTIIMENYAQEREDFLIEHDRVEEEVMEDEKGEYVLIEPNLMDEGEPEDSRLKKVYLPVNPLK